jgi:hypothetical protein
VLHVGEALADASDGFRRLRFRAFDLLEDGGVDVTRRPYAEKWPRLQRLLGAGVQVDVVETVEGTAATAFQCFARWVGGEGAEGVVVRTEFGTTLKVKPSFTVDAVVVGFGEHMLQAGAELGELAVALMRVDGTFHVVGGVSVGWTLDQQLDLHQRLQKMRVPSTYRLPNHDGMLCRFVRPELVVEVKANELLDLDSHGEPLRRMVLRYDPAAGWTGVGPMPVASLVFPVFLGERRDKLVDPGCVGLEQIYQRAPFDHRHLQASAVREQPRSVVVERRVWKKIVRGRTTVRKYVAIKTNKDGDHPPFVVHFTDYAPGREDPLRTEVVVAGSRDSLDQAIRRWVTARITRGWFEM